MCRCVNRRGLTGAGDRGHGGGLKAQGEDEKCEECFHEKSFQNDTPQLNPKTFVATIVKVGNVADVAVLDMLPTTVPVPAVSFTIKHW